MLDRSLLYKGCILAWRYTSGKLNSVQNGSTWTLGNAPTLSIYFTEPWMILLH
uniref:Uncharacterized protein n=1 Tax=Arundo donax TaxID=35708 RepID=A0A0A9CZP6_ARUDO